MRDACQVIRAEPGMSSTNMSSDVPKPEDVLWATFPLRLSTTRVGVETEGAGSQRLYLWSWHARDEQSHQGS